MKKWLNKGNLVSNKIFCIKLKNTALRPSKKSFSRTSHRDACFKCIKTYSCFIQANTKCEATELPPSPPSYSKLKNCKRCDIKNFTWFSFQPKSATEIGWCLVRWVSGFRRIVNEIFPLLGCYAAQVDWQLFIDDSGRPMLHNIPEQRRSHLVLCKFWKIK